MKTRMGDEEAELVCVQKVEEDYKEVVRGT